MPKDVFGVYETTFTYVEPDNGKTYELRKYVNSGKIKNLGGMYAIFCQEDNCIVFRRSEYLRDKSYKRFSEGNCLDAIDCDPWEKIVDILTENQSEVKKDKCYNLPGKIDKTKLTIEEFETLRNLIKKGLAVD